MRACQWQRITLCCCMKLCVRNCSVSRTALISMPYASLRGKKEICVRAIHGEWICVCRFSSHPSTLMVRAECASGNAWIDCASPVPFYNHWGLELQGNHPSSCHVYLFDLGNIAGSDVRSLQFVLLSWHFSVGLHIRLQYLWEQVGCAIVSFVETPENIIFSEAIKSQSLTRKINLFGEIESALVCCHWREMPQTVSPFNKSSTDAQA